MASFILSLLSSASKRSGLAILNTATGFHPLLTDHPAACKLDQAFYRGIAVSRQNIYIVTPRNIQLYDFCGAGETSFTLQKEFSYPDWYLASGTRQNTGLVAIMLSSRRDRIFVGNNSQAAVDELSLEGDFVRRHSLWDISPGIFKKPEGSDFEFTYGQIRHFIETKDGNICLAVANCSNSSRGKIIDFDTGECLLDGLQNPQGGAVSHGLYILQENQQKTQGKLLAYPVNQGRPIGLGKPAWEASLQGEKGYADGPQLFRGLAIADDRLYCGVTTGSHPGQQKQNLIVSYDIMTGRQIDSFILPDLPELVQPRVFGMALIPEDQASSPRAAAGKGIPAPETENHPAVNGSEAEPNGLQHIQSREHVPTENHHNHGNEESSGHTVNPLPAGDKNRKTSERKLSIDAQHVSLCYRRIASLLSFNRRSRTAMAHWALRDVSFSINEGDTVALIGRNGSGKSTLSMLISGALKPDSGTITTNGRVQLLALGIGFRPMLTGRDNVMISGTILGLTRREVQARMAEIEEFAELGDFFDEPIRTYSAGMRSRLGFAVATAVRPDILILDEVMSTGDASFRAKANERMDEMREKTKTVIIVSHNPEQIKDICTRVLWLEKGKLIMDGSPDEILPVYGKFSKKPAQWLANHPELRALLEQPPGPSKTP